VLLDLSHSISHSLSLLEHALDTIDFLASLFLDAAMAGASLLIDVSSLGDDAHRRRYSAFEYRILTQCDVFRIPVQTSRKRGVPAIFDVFVSPFLLYVEER
jgi:hypothetical protein